jgi:hypothetical protein
MRHQSIHGKFECACCGYASLSAWDQSEICDICYWEDDGADDDIVSICPANNTSLETARINFIECGACEPKWVDVVRKPLDSESRLRRFYIQDGKLMCLVL